MGLQLPGVGEAAGLLQECPPLSVVSGGNSEAGPPKGTTPAVAQKTPEQVNTTSGGHLPGVAGILVGGHDDSDDASRLQGSCVNDVLADEERGPHRWSHDPAHPGEHDHLLTGVVQKEWSSQEKPAGKRSSDSCTRGVTNSASSTALLCRKAKIGSRVPQESSSKVNGSRRIAGRASGAGAPPPSSAKRKPSDGAAGVSSRPLPASADRPKKCRSKQSPFSAGLSTQQEHLPPPRSSASSVAGGGFAPVVATGTSTPRAAAQEVVLPRSREAPRVHPVPRRGLLKGSSKSSTTLGESSTTRGGAPARTNKRGGPLSGSQTRTVLVKQQEAVEVQTPVRIQKASGSVRSSRANVVSHSNAGTAVTRPLAESSAMTRAQFPRDDSSRVAGCTTTLSQNCQGTVVPAPTVLSERTVGAGTIVPSTTLWPPNATFSRAVSPQLLSRAQTPAGRLGTTGVVVLMPPASRCSSAATPSSAIAAQPAAAPQPRPLFVTPQFVSFQLHPPSSRIPAPIISPYPRQGFGR